MKYVYPTTHIILGISPNGRRISLRCPSANHNDKTPSFVIYPNGGFHCFGCGLHGKNGLDFLIRVLDNSYQESMAYLKDKNYLTTIH